MVAYPDKPIVYLPESRHYGHYCVEPGDDFFVVGRVYVRLSEPDVHRSFAVRPYEGGLVRRDTVDFYPQLMELPAANTNFTLAQLVDMQELAVGGRRFFLDLARRDWSEYNPFCRISQDSLALKGLVAGHAYVVAEWVIPRYAIRLDGVEGIYYAGIFREHSSD